MELQLEFQGLFEAQSLLSQLSGRVQRPAPLMNQIANILEDTIAQSFENERSPSGGAWPALAPSTIQQRQRKGLVPIKKLNATGQGKSEILVLISGTQVSIEIGRGGTEYMRVHQKGSARTPQRQFAPEAEDVERGELGDRISTAADNYLNPGLGSFLRQEVARTPILGRVFGG